MHSGRISDISQRIAPEHIAQVRRFNRTATERAGALDDAFLGRRRPLGQARLLWEIGTDGADVRDLRSRLGLDSGYVSRLLRALENDGLVSVGPAANDARRRRATLTARGLTEWHELEARSDERATSLLEPLGERARTALVDAMAIVERLLTASSVAINEADPRHGDARWCLEQYLRELADRCTPRSDPSRGPTFALSELRPPNGTFLVARSRGCPVGCAGLRRRGTEPPEIKRMWVAPEARGLGLGRRLLGEIERRAAADGAHTVRLETNRALLEAIALYRASGYREVAPFNEEPYAHLWFEKRL
jgi:DNA-binding MarR family transcriptional regulator/GNAT superfamily N-acetyltransferase